MRNPIIKQFVVEGQRRFPFAMLNAAIKAGRARAADAAAIAAPLRWPIRHAGRTDHPRNGREICAQPTALDRRSVGA